MNKIRVTTAEYNAIINEIAKRFKDLVYVNVNNRLRQAWTKSDVKALLNKTDDEIEVTFTLKFIGNDLLQILQRERRTRRPT